MQTTDFISIKHIIMLSLVVVVMFSCIGIDSTFAASCSGSTCEGMNPNTMGCSAYRSGNVFYLDSSGSYVETRASSDCDAKWARTTNKYNGYLYLAATLRYGGSNYDYHKEAATPGSVSYNSVVYTPMHAYKITPTRSCGKVSTTGPISVPIALSSLYCTTQN